MSATSTQPSKSSPPPAIRQHEELAFRNRGVESDKWYFSKNREERLTQRVNVLGFFVLVIATFILASINLPVVAVCTFVFGALIATFALPPLSAKLIERHERKRIEYRWEHLFSIMDGLTLRGWEIDAESYMEQKRTLIENDNPYIRNADGVRYYCQTIYVGKNDIIIQLVLSDPEVKARNAEIEAAKRIEFLIQKHEQSHGQMSPEMKTGFIAGCKAYNK